MTRFASWDSKFWTKGFGAYENGFGLVNQQWIGLKKLYQITNAFVTDMRVDYTFKEDLTFSTMYYNISVSSNDYVFSYSAYDSRGCEFISKCFSTLLFFIKKKYCYDSFIKTFFLIITSKQVNKFGTNNL